MHVLATAQRAIVVVAHVAPLAPTQPPLTVATSPPVQVVMPNPPLSAYAQSPRQLQQLTVNKEKFRKEQKGRNTGVATRGNTVAFGDFGLKSTDRGRLTARQIASARRAISRHVKRGGRIWIRVFPDKPISQKPAEVRMGNGKGNPEYYVAEIQPGKVLYEIVGVPEELAREAFKLAAAKLPLRTTFEKQEMNAAELRQKDVAG
eukprot:gene33050-55619_t